jgi:phage-related minor tail protein
MEKKRQKYAENVAARQQLLERTIAKYKKQFEGSEPTEGKVARIAFKLPNGDRVIRKFRASDSVEVT